MGSWGWKVTSAISVSLYNWQKLSNKEINFIYKGGDPISEHYSAIRPEIKFGKPGQITDDGKILLDSLLAADRIVFAGEALSHCFANTIRDIADFMGERYIKRFFLLEDCSSSVPGFEKLGEDFVKEMVEKGMNVVKSTDF